MSAFLCDEKIFNQITNTLLHYAEYEPHHASRTAYASSFILSTIVHDKDGTVKLHPTAYEKAAVFAKRLYDMNLEAVSQRYKDGGNDDYGYDYKGGVPLNNMTALYKKTTCLLYQCSEGDVPETDLFKRLEGISDALAHDIVSNSKEYDQIGWGD